MDACIDLYADRLLLGSILDPEKLQTHNDYV